MKADRRGGTTDRRAPARTRSVLAVVTLLCAAMLPLLGLPLFRPATAVTASAAVPAVPTAGGRLLSQVGAGGAGGVTAAAPVATDPAYPYLGYLRTTITGITPTVVTSSTGPSITVTGTMSNTSSGTIYDLRYVWQRGSALAGVRAIKAEIARPSRTATVVGEDSRILGPTLPPTTGTRTPATTKQVDLAPGASASFVATIGVGSDGLKIGARGVYALTVKVTGDIGQNGNTQYERVGEIHLLSTVLSVPLPALPTASGGRPPASTAGNGATTGAGPTARPVSATLLWPVVDTPHLGVDGVFLDDALATTIAPGGRLFGVLSALGAFPAAGAAPTLVVDPQLLDEVARMAGGYRVVATPGAAQAPLTASSAPTTTSPGTSSGIPTTDGSGTDTAGADPSGSTGSSSSGEAAASTTSSPGVLAPNGAAQSTSISVQDDATPTTGTRSPAGPPPADTVAGTGQSAAVAFLSRLRAAARTHQVLVLPYSDPDSVAMMRAGLDDQLAALISRGRSVATSVLQPQPGDPGLITDTLVPAAGAVNDATLGFVSTHGIAHAVLAPTTVKHAGGPVGVASIDERADKGVVVTAALTDADLLAQLTDLVARGRTAGLATRLTTTAALLTGGSLDGTGTPLVVLPDRSWTANAAGLSVLSGLLQTLATGKVVAPTALPALLETATTPATLAYSPTAENAELAPGYLAQVLADTRTIAAVGGSLVQARAPGSPDPADLLDPLRTALSSAGAAALRADPSYGFRVLQTVGATLDGLRSQVSIVDQAPSRLAASTAPLLITVRNDLPYGVRVRVVVTDGAPVGMTTTDPALESIPEGGSHQFRIDASVVKAGRFQVHAQIEAADGSSWAAPTTVTVISSAYGTLTIVLIVVAGGALTLMVGVRLVQRVRNRNRPGAEGSAGSAAAGSDTGPGPDSILAAADESTRRHSGGTGGPGNPAGDHASVPPASPTVTPPTVTPQWTEQGEPPR